MANITPIQRRILTCALLTALAACASASTGASPGAPTSPPNPVTNVSIPLGINTGNKPGYHLTISVGGGKAHDFLLDTGSSSLWVFPNAIGKSYRKTTYAESNTYSSGIVYTGIVVYTHVDFGNGVSTVELPVVLVQKASCEATQPTCPAQAGSSFCPTVKPGPNAGIECVEAGRKLYGTFGADMTTFDLPNSTAPVAVMYNVIFGIARPFAHAFAVTPGALIVGERSLDGYAKMPLTAASPPPKPLPNGALSWKRDVTLCYTIAQLKNTCYDTLFDTGASDVGFQTGDALPTTDSKCGHRVTPGLPFSAATSGGIVVASFNAGNLTNFNRIINQKLKQSPQVNTGMTFFNRNVIYYDAEKGIVAITPLAKPVHVAQQGCGSSS